MRFCRKAKVWGAAAFLVAAPLAAQDLGYQGAFEFCATQTKNPEIRADCIEEWRRSLLQIIEYGQAGGYLDETGELDMSEVTGAFLNWGTVVGLPPRDPFIRCLGRAPVFGMADYREVWRCIKRLDPEAAKRDAI